VDVSEADEQVDEEAQPVFEFCQTSAFGEPVTVKDAEVMKLPPVVPWETSTKLLPEDGTAIVTPAGMAPPAVDVNVVPVPLGQAEELAWKQYE
jgi:hypothetical protein